ncbi:MAG: segregation/condensation protein A [Gemmatimonadota bacterium]
METTTPAPPQEAAALLVVDLDRFQGPLDLLLHLIRQQDIDIFDIPISRITHQFLAAIQGIQAVDLENAGEFLEMAATLVRIKAQMLLPRHGDDEEDDPRAELVRRLLEYEQIREIAERLLHAEAERGRRRGKGYIEARAPRKVEETPLETTWEEVHKAALRVTLPDPVPHHEHRVTLRPVAIEEKVDLILDSLRAEARVRFSRLVRPWKERMHGVMTLLAGLELSRRRLVALRQLRPFAELWVFRQNDEEPVPRDVLLEEDPSEAA